MPPRKGPGQGGYGPQGNREMDDQYRRLADPNNLSRSNQDRLQRITDQSDGQDLDPLKVD